MLCTSCHFENPPKAKFCAQCGHRLASVCPRCRAEAEPDHRFCCECGAPLEAPAEHPGVDSAPEAKAPARQGPSPAPQPPPAFESEIKQVTVLSCELDSDLAGSEEPEVLHALLDHFLQLAREEVRRLGGVVNQQQGRGFLALFGAPVALEDHGLRAVLAAIALRRQLADLGSGAERQGVRCSARMGLDTGPVVMGGSAGIAAGEATETGRRLCQAAPTGAILLSDRLASFLGPQIELEAVERPGSDADQEPQPVWSLVSTTGFFAAAPRFRSGVLSPFVGRERETGMINDLRRQAEAGQGQVVGLAGEAGSGKSRLLFESSRARKDLRASYLRGQCLSYATGIPFFPFIDMIRRASRITDADEPSAVAAKLRGSLEAVGLPPDEVLPYLLRLLDVESGADGLAGTEPQTLQSQIFTAMRRMLLAASRRNLVVMEVEDLHWIDETSEEFLDSLIEAMAGSRMLLLLTYRSGYRPRWLQKSYATQITMRRLSDDESRQVVKAITGEADTDDGRVSGIVEMAEGNAFFLEELARTLLEDTDAPVGARIPGTVQGVLMARIDRLPEPHKHLLQVASVLGREFSAELVERIWDRPEPLSGLLDDLQGWELLVTTTAEEPTVYSFRHSLTQEVAYQSLLKSRRRLLHRQVAESLETLFADRLEDVYGRLAYHYPRAGAPEKTVHYLVLFAERAARQYSHAEAAKALREALCHAERLPEDGRDRQIVAILLRLAESLFPLARLSETLEIFESYASCLDRVEDPSLKARVHFWLAHTHTYLGHQEEVRRHCRLAIEAAQQSADEATEGKALYVLGRDAFWAGDFPTGLEHSLRAVVLLERSGEAWWQGQAYWVTGFHHWALGQFEQALTSLRRAFATGEALDDYRLDSSWSIGFVHASLGNWQEGIEECERGVERSRDPLNTAVAMGFLGYAYLQKGDLDVAVQTLRESVQQLMRAGMQHLLGWVTVFLADAYLRADRLEEAREAATEGLAVSSDAGFAYGVGAARQVLGRVALAAGDLEEARCLLEEAARAFEALGAPFELAHARMALARVSAADGDRERARRDLETARTGFADVGAAVYAGRARALAGELGLGAPAEAAS